MLVRHTRRGSVEVPAAEFVPTLYLALYLGRDFASPGRSHRPSGRDSWR